MYPSCDGHQDLCVCKPASHKAQPCINPSEPVGAGPVITCAAAPQQLSGSGCELFGCSRPTPTALRFGKGMLAIRLPGGIWAMMVSTAACTSVHRFLLATTELSPAISPAAVTGMHAMMNTPDAVWSQGSQLNIHWRLDVNSTCPPQGYSWWDLGFNTPGLTIKSSVVPHSIPSSPLHLIMDAGLQCPW